MWDFSGDEWIFFLAAGAIGSIRAIRWYGTILRAPRLTFSAPHRVSLAAVPLVALTLLYVVLQTLSDPVYVAGHLDYTLLFMLGGVLWIFASLDAFRMLGIGAIDDAIDRANPAATIALCGGTLGVSIAYAYSNIGNGPTIWTTLVPALIATLTLLGLWGLIEAMTDTADAVTIDRDVATGIRLGAFLLCAGAILGRAMAGDWQDWPGTFAEFVLRGWPALPLGAAIVAVHNVARPTPDRPKPSVLAFGLMPASVILVLTVSYLIWLGAPQIAPAGKFPPAQRVEAEE